MSAATRRALRAAPQAGAGLVATVAEWVILTLLGRVSVGALRVELPDGQTRLFGDPNAQPETLRIRRDAFFHRLAVRGRIGFGEAYVEGDWDSDDLPAVLGLFARNIEQARATPPLSTLVHASRYRPRLVLPNTRRRAQRNIHYHYDLGNDFYALFLDESMTYSCAVFDDPQATLEQAQTAKFRRITSQLALTPHDHLLEIGCGWGGFAIHAARECGCRVTGITISRAQYQFAARRVEQLGLDHLVDIRYEDYRETTGCYSRVVSVEMLEAVGARQYPVFFAAVDRLLARDGLALIQTITIPDQRFASYRRTRDFIQAYVFPGGMLPSVQAMINAMTRVSPLMLVGLEEIGPHYAETLRHWRERFLSRRDDVHALGFDDRLVRIWDYYLSFCEAGFRERVLRDCQIVLSRPANPALPLRAAWTPNR
jgi:cyclopropane-fatty-acyl-phospholipid synthase